MGTHPVNMATISRNICFIALFLVLSCHDSTKSEETSESLKDFTKTNVPVAMDRLEKAPEVGDYEYWTSDDDLYEEELEPSQESTIIANGVTPANNTLESFLNLTKPQIGLNFANTSASDKLSKKVVCAKRNITVNASLEVKIVNSTELLNMLTLKNETQGVCSLVLFFAPWCVFCAETAPHYNAMARAFPGLDVMAIDAIHFNNLNARFGTIAVPNILLFHNTKAVARFNHTVRNFESLLEFVKNVTGLDPAINASLTGADYLGPLSSKATEEHDYILIASWIFVISFFSVMLYRSRTGQQVAQLLASFGQEHHHQHID